MNFQMTGKLSIGKDTEKFFCNVERKMAGCKRPYCHPIDLYRTWAAAVFNTGKTFPL